MSNITLLPIPSFRESDGEDEAQEIEYAKQAEQIKKRAELALVTRQMEELAKAKKAISLDYESATAQLMLAQVR